MNFTTFTLAQWIAAVNQTVTQYGNGISAWEIWNEPCFPQNYLGIFQGSPSQYVELMSTAYPIIKAAYPNATVLGLGGLPLYTGTEGPSSDSTWVQYSLDFTQQVVALGGMNYCDAISLHAYPYGSLTNYVLRNWSQSYSQYEAITSKGVWITETGQESVGEPIPWSSTTEQSNYMIESYPFLHNLSVKAYFWYELQDNSSFTDYTFGLYDVNGVAKPSLETYFNLVTSTPTSTTSPTPTTTTPSATEFPFTAVAIVLIGTAVGILFYKTRRITNLQSARFATESKADMSSIVKSKLNDTMSCFLFHDLLEKFFF
jgi:hypothetical protein